MCKKHIIIVLALSLFLTSSAGAEVIWDFENGNDHGFTLWSLNPATPAADVPNIAGDESLTGVGGDNGLPDAGLAWTIGEPNQFEGLIPAIVEGCHVLDGVLQYGPCNDPFGAAAVDPPYDFTNSRGQSSYLNTYNLSQWGDGLHSASNDQIATSPPVLLLDGAVLTVWAHGGGVDTHAPVIQGEGYTDDSSGIAVRSAADNSLLASVLTDGQITLRQDTIDLSAFVGQTVYIDVVDAFEGTWGWIGVDEIYITNAIDLIYGSILANGPIPENKAMDVTRDTDLIWTPGRFARTHNVYFGTDFNDVNDASIDDPRDILVSPNQTGRTYNLPQLDFAQTYYWRVDEVNDRDPNSPWKGNVWSFTTANFLPVDDFESYNDVDNIIYDTWLDYYVNNTGMTVGYIDFPSVEKDIIHLGKQSMPLQYDNDGTINEGTELEKTGTLYYSEAECRWDKPQDWTQEGVESLTIWFRGYPTQVSSFVEEPAGIFTVKGIGEDIWDSSDQFHFAYKEVSGACKITARVDSLVNTDPFAKAGIMIRDTLDANARYCALLITPENGVRFQYRAAVDDTTDRQFDPNVAVPYWIRLEHTSGGLVRAYYSENGSDWTSFSLRQITMSNPIYIGLAVTSHDPVVVCESKFSNVSFPDTTVGPEWTSQDIGLLTNDIEPLYVILNNNAVIYHDDPNATSKDQWTEWNIPLQRFADQGVDLTNIDTLGIGLGDRDNQQPGGEGIMYIDDIRLYRSN